MGQRGLKKTPSDNCVFVQKLYDSNSIIVLLYIGDMFVGDHNACWIRKLKQESNKPFAMKYLGPTRQILGMQVVSVTGGQEIVAITREIREFNMDKAKV